jgi:hypothetical protein
MSSVYGVCAGACAVNYRWCLNAYISFLWLLSFLVKHLTFFKCCDKLQ